MADISTAGALPCLNIVLPTQLWDLKAGGVTRVPTIRTDQTLRIIKWVYDLTVLDNYLLLAFPHSIHDIPWYAFQALAGLEVSEGAERWKALTSSRLVHIKASLTLLASTTKYIHTVLICVLTYTIRVEGVAIVAGNTALWFSWLDVAVEVDAGAILKMESILAVKACSCLDVVVGTEGWHLGTLAHIGVVAIFADQADTRSGNIGHLAVGEVLFLFWFLLSGQALSLMDDKPTLAKQAHSLFIIDVAPGHLHFLGDTPIPWDNIILLALPTEPVSSHLLTSLRHIYTNIVLQLVAFLAG